MSIKFFDLFFLRDEMLKPSQFLLVGWFIILGLMQLGAVYNVSIYTMALVLFNITSIAVAFLGRKKTIPLLGAFIFSLIFIFLDIVNTGAIKESIRMGLIHTVYISAIIAGFYILIQISFFWFMVILGCAGTAMFFFAFATDRFILPLGIIYSWNTGSMFVLLIFLLLNFKKRILTALFLLFGFFILYFWDRRAESFMFAGAVGIYAFLFFTGKTKPITRIALTTSLFFLSLILFYFVVLPNIAFSEQMLARREGSNHGRIEMVQSAWQDFKEAPLTGKSFNSRVQIVNEYGKARFTTVHNIILQFGVYYGISGLIFALIPPFIHFCGLIAFIGLNTQFRKSIFKGRELFALYIILMINHDWLNSLMAMKNAAVQGMSTGFCLYCIYLYLNQKKIAKLDYAATKIN